MNERIILSHFSRKYILSMRTEKVICWHSGQGEFQERDDNKCERRRHGEVSVPGKPSQYVVTLWSEIWQRKNKHKQRTREREENKRM
jgi:hypothetical protein